MITKKQRARNKPIVTDAQKTVIIGLLMKIIGDTIKGKIGRVVAAGVVAAAATYLDVPVPAQAPAVITPAPSQGVLVNNADLK